MQAEILKYLPYGLREEIDVKNIENAEELRIRAGAATSVISYGSEKTLNFKATRKGRFRYRGNASEAFHIRIYGRA